MTLVRTWQEKFVSNQDDIPTANKRDFQLSTGKLRQATMKLHKFHLQHLESTSRTGISHSNSYTLFLHPFEPPISTSVVEYRRTCTPFAGDLTWANINCTLSFNKYTTLTTIRLVDVSGSFERGKGNGASGTEYEDRRHGYLICAASSDFSQLRDTDFELHIPSSSRRLRKWTSCPSCSKFFLLTRLLSQYRSE